MSIPGLDFLPTKTPEVSSSEEIRIQAFDGSFYTIPDSHRYGKCRLVTDFKKIGDRPLGLGLHGIVYKAEDKDTQEIVALKKLKIDFQEDDGIPHRIIREISLLKEINHINILNIKDVVIGASLDSMYLVTEFCAHDLSVYIDKSKNELKEQEIKCLVQQLFEGLNYLHQNYIVHRDLTTSNLLITKKGILKIADFGLARKFSIPPKPMTPNVTLLWYRSPELLFGAGIQTAAVDMWAAGCIFGELLLKTPVFQGTSEIQQIEHFIDLLGTPNDNIWPGFSSIPIMQSFTLKKQPYNNIKRKFSFAKPGAISLLQKLFIYNPPKRGTSQDCLKHAYFSEEPPPCLPEAIELVTDSDDM